MSTKTESSFDVRDGIGLAGLAMLGAGVAQFSWPIALIVVGVILIAVAAGWLR